MVQSRTFTARSADDTARIVDTITCYLWIKPTREDYGIDQVLEYVPEHKPTVAGITCMISEDHTLTIYYNPVRCILPIHDLFAHIAAYAPVKGY